MSGLMGDLKTLGSVTLSELALPSAEMTVTVGRLVILSVVVAVDAVGQTVVR